MKSSLTILLVLSFSLGFAQSVVVSEVEASADPSAILDIQSDSKGMLIPRMSLLDRLDIDAPVEGLLVYQTNDVKGFYYYDGSEWTAFINTSSITDFGSGSIITTDERDLINSSVQVEEDPVFAAQILDAGSGNVITDAERAKLNSINITGAVPVGTVLSFAGDTTKIPDGWLICNGDPILRNEFSELFNVIGENWGAGDGVNTFNLPDLRGRFLRGTDLSSSNDPDLATRIGGGGDEKVGSYQDDELKSHTHEIRAGHTVELNLLTGGPKNKVAPSGSSLQSVSATTVASAGGAESRPKNAYVNYIIKY